MTDNPNMELWDSWCETPADAPRKDVKGKGMKITSVDAQWQIKLATKTWGPYGTTWGVKNLIWGEVGKLKTTYGRATPVHMTGPAEITLSATFWYPDGEFEIGGDCYWRPDGDSRKKLLTDITTKALSKIGMCSDIFEGKFDGNKYVDQPQTQAAQPAQQQAPPPQQPAQTAPQPTPVAQAPPPVQTPQPAAPVVQSDEMHPLFIESAEAKTSSKGNAMVQVNMAVTNGVHISQNVKEFLTFGVGFALNKANRFVQCATGAPIVQPADPFGIAQVLHGQSIMAKLKTKQYTAKDGSPQEGLEIDGMNVSAITTVPPASTHAPAQQQIPQDGNDDDISLDEDIMMDEDNDFL